MGIGRPSGYERAAPECSQSRRRGDYFARLTAFTTTSKKASLAKIGLLSFAAIAQFRPCLLRRSRLAKSDCPRCGRRHSRGFAVWAYTLLLPTLIEDSALGASLLQHGPFGLAFLRPEMLFYMSFDPMTHGVVWSFFFNMLAFVSVSLLRPLEPIERLQTNIFIEGRQPAAACAGFQALAHDVPYGRSRGDGVPVSRGGARACQRFA